MRRFTVWAIPVSILLVGCATTSDPGLPSGELNGVPWRGAAFDDLVIEARLANDSGDREEARRLLGRVLDQAPDHVDAHRLEQDMLRAAGRHGRVLHDARQRVDEQPEDSAAWYLLGRAESNDDARWEAFGRALELDPQSFFGWLGVGFLASHTDPVQAEAIFLALDQSTGGHPLVDHNLAAVYSTVGDHEAALETWTRMADRELEPGRAALGRAQALLQLSRPAEAFRASLEALALRPHDPAVRRLIELQSVSSLPAQAIEEIVDLMLARPEIREEFLAAGGLDAWVDLLRRTGDGAAAAEALLETEASDNRAYRLALLDAGAVGPYLDALDRFVPLEIRLAEDNQVRALWSRVLDGPYRRSPRVLDDPSELTGLATALADCGLLEEAERLLTVGLLRGGAGDDSARELRDRLRRELAFIHNLRRRLYSTFESGGELTLEALLTQLREDSEELLGEDVVGNPTQFEVPFAGALLDPFGPGLCAWFRARNLHLLLGARSGGSADGFLVTRVSVRDLDEDGPLPLRGPAKEVLGDAREIRSLRAVLGGDLAGVALLNHYVIDLGAIRDWADGLVRARQIARETTDNPLEDPLPHVEDPMDPLDAMLRWNFACPLDDDELFLAVLDLVQWHERAHLADVFYYLPIEDNLGRILGLLFGQGLSPLGVESQFEGRAEAIALAYSAYPSLVLAHIADFVPKRDSKSSHARGFARLARWLNDELDTNRSEDAPRAAVSRWIERDSAEIRRAARRIATRLGS
ncbi:MAG: hypothetical protein AAF196_12265 [Planctomycetota bacterium]